MAPCITVSSSSPNTFAKSLNGLVRTLGHVMLLAHVIVNDVDRVDVARYEGDGGNRRRTGLGSGSIILAET